MLYEVITSIGRLALHIRVKGKSDKFEKDLVKLKPASVQILKEAEKDAADYMITRNNFV